MYLESLRGGRDLLGVAAAGLYWRLTAALEPVARQVRIVVKATAVFLLDAIINLFIIIDYLNNNYYMNDPDQKLKSQIT